MSSSEEAEFESLVKRQSRFVFRVAYAILRNSHDAEDAAQETFLKLYRNSTWKGIENERAFLARVAWRIAIDRLPKRNAAETMQEINSDLIDDPAANAPDPEQQAISANTEAAVHRLIDALPEELRQPLALSTVDELNSREVAAILNIPEGTVRTRLMRARQMLKEKMARLPAAKESRYAR